MNPYNMTAYIRYSVHRECPAGGWKIESRTIPDHEFVLITGGAGYVTIEGKTYPARQGMLFYFYPELVHSLESTTDNPMSFYAVHFSYAHVDYQNSGWSIEPVHRILPIKPVNAAFTYLKLEELLKSLNRYWSDKFPGYELVCSGLFLQFLHAILQHISTDNMNYASRLKIEEIIQHIHKHLNEELSLSALAEIASLSPDYLTCIFKRTTGCSLIQYINKCRVDAAKALLTQENRKIKDVAGMVGYRDEFYFSRVFKKYEGVSPLEFNRVFHNSYI